MSCRLGSKKKRHDTDISSQAIVHAVANRVLSDHTAKNIFGNVNYAEHFLQGSVVGAFDGRAPGGKNAVWKLTVDFQMPSDDLGAEVELKRVDVHRQHCFFGPIPAGKKPPCSVTFMDSIGDPDHAVKGSTTYLPNAEGRVAAAAATAATADADDDDVAAAPCVSLSPAAPLIVAAPAGDEIEVIVPPPPPPPPPTDAAPPAKTKKKRKNATSTLRDDASTATRPPTTPAAKKSKPATKKKKASESVDLCKNPVWVTSTDGKRHRVVAIAHEQKWVAGIAATITGDVADEHASIHQWCHKDPFGERIAPGDPEHANMTPLQAFLHMMPPAQLSLILELTNERLAEKEN